MYGLQDEYADRVDFVHLNVDDDEQMGIAAEYGVVRRSTYVLTASDGTIVRTWIGPLSRSDIREAFGPLVDELAPAGG